MVRVSGVGVYQRVQWSEEKRGDMVGHKGVDQRGIEHVCVSCTHGMTKFLMILYKTVCLWYCNDARGVGEYQC